MSQLPIISAGGGVPSPTLEEGNATEQVAKTLNKVLQAKQDLWKEEQQNRFRIRKGLPDELVLNGGDFFTAGSIGLQLAQFLKPSLSAVPAFAIADFFFGELAGLINIGVGLASLKQAIRAWKSGDPQAAMQGWRLFVDFLSFVGIGLLLFLTSLAIRVGALSAVSTFFTANPWLLPLLFFIATVPLFCEIWKQRKRLVDLNGIYAQLQANPSILQNYLLHGNCLGIKSCIEIAEQSGESEITLKERLSDVMEALQAEVGVEAALAAFELFKCILFKQRVEEQQAQAEVLHKRLSEWEYSIKVRYVQQWMYLLALPATLLGIFLPWRIATQVFSLVEQAFLTIANTIALCMDLFWPDRRNTRLITPRVC